MKRKVFFIIKFIISMAIIFSMMLPSFATSDDGMYIRKSQLDSALAEFNTRLSAFEAGINNKIDTQVSSYLDRNGIWTKEEQILTHANGRYGILNSWNFTIDTIRNKDGNNDVCPETHVIVNEFNKAGLCNMVIQTFKLGSVSKANWEAGTAPNTDSPNGYGTIMYNWTDSGGGTSYVNDVTSYRAHAWVYFKFIETYNSVNTDKIFYKISESTPTIYAWSVSTTNYAHTISFVPDKQSLYFFVNKGGKLSSELHVALASNYYGSTPYRFNTVSTGSPTGMWGYQVKIDVY